MENTSGYDARFWRDTERHHDTAEMFEKNITRYHPSAVTSDGLCSWVNYDIWMASCVDYYRYDGESIK